MIDFCFASNAKEFSKFGGCVFYLAYNHIMVDFCFALSEKELSGFGQYVYFVYSKEDEFCDVTLACENSKILYHKVVFSIQLSI